MFLDFINIGFVEKSAPGKKFHLRVRDMCVAVQVVIVQFVLDCAQAEIVICFVSCHVFLHQPDATILSFLATGTVVGGQKRGGYDPPGNSDFQILIL